MHGKKKKPDTLPFRWYEQKINIYIYINNIYIFIYIYNNNHNNHNNHNNNNKVYLYCASPYINMFALGTLQNELRQKR